MKFLLSASPKQVPKEMGDCIRLHKAARGKEKALTLTGIKPMTLGFHCLLGTLQTELHV